MLEFIFYMLAETTPFHLFAYVPFWNHLRFSKKTTVILLLAEQAVFMIEFFILIRLGFSAALAQCCAVPLYGPLFFYFVKMDWGKIAFLYIFTTDYLMTIVGLVSFLGQSSGMFTLFTWQAGVLILFFFFLTLPFMLHYICTTAKLIFAINAPALWKKLWLLPLFTSLIVISFTYPAESLTLRALFARIFLMICMLLIYYQIIQMIQQFQKQAAAEEQARSIEQLLHLQSEQYSLIQSHITEIHRARHDLRQHWRVLQGCVDNRDFDALAKYIKDYGKNLPADFIHTFCSSVAVNAVISFYYEKAVKENISIHISLPLDMQAIIPEPELCILLGNLLENALDACMMANSPSFIHVNGLQTRANVLSLTVDNTCLKPPRFEQQRLLSTKHDGFGVGTDSIRTIAERYDGEARFEWKDNVFYASVMLRP